MHARENDPSDYGPGMRLDMGRNGNEARKYIASDTSSLTCICLLLQGLPFPSNEFNAIDVVVRYSVSELGFTFEDIILFAWSIGKDVAYVNLHPGH